MCIECAPPGPLLRSSDIEVVLNRTLADSWKLLCNFCDGIFNVVRVSGVPLWMVLRVVAYCSCPADSDTQRVVMTIGGRCRDGDAGPRKAHFEDWQGWCGEKEAMQKFGHDTLAQPKVLRNTWLDVFATTGSDSDRSDEVCQFRGGGVVIEIWRRGAQ